MKCCPKCGKEMAYGPDFCAWCGYTDVKPSGLGIHIPKKVRIGLKGLAWDIIKYLAALVLTAIVMTSPVWIMLLILEIDK